MKKNILIGLILLLTIAMIGYNQYQMEIKDQNAGEIKLIDEQSGSNEIKDIND